MPFRQTPVTHTPYGLMAFDNNGVERKDDPDGLNGLLSERLLESLRESKPTDVFLFSHGWRGDIESAADQYNRWIDAMAKLNTDANRMGPGFRAMWIGLHWPSEPWGEEELAGPSTSFDVNATPSASSKLLETYLDRLDLTSSLRARELMSTIFRENQINPAATVLPENVAAAYAELANSIGYDSKGPGAEPSADNAPFDAQAAFVAMNSTGVAFGGGVLGGLLGPLRQLTFWTMKKRARTVGEGGMHDFVQALQTVAPTARIHLMGHSFGTIVTSAICGGPNGNSPLLRPIDSLVLVQGAVSLWCFADSIPSTGGKGYFNSMFHRPGVRGPIVTTRSRFDIAVNVWYPAAVSLVLQNPSFDIGPSVIIWGAIGAFGIQGIAGAIDQPMLPETSDYHFENKIYNLESSEYIRKMSGASGAHSDIDGPQVAHAIWQAALASMGGTSAATPFAPAARVAAAAGTPAPTPVAAPAVRVTSTTSLTDADKPIPFGIDAETGKPLPLIQPRDLDHIDKDPNLLRIRAGNAGAAHLSITAEANADLLSSAGWGIVFAAGMDQAARDAIKDALAPLINKRKNEAGPLFHLFEGASGYKDGQSADQWLVAQGSSDFNVVDPTQGVPYYLLLVGSPDQIPFDFQYELDIFFAVGRLYFENPAEYAKYAANIVAFENGAATQAKSIAIFNTRNEGDVATAMLHDQVAVPMALGRGDVKPVGASMGYSLTPCLADNATKKGLLDLLTNGVNGAAPALLFTGSHGVSFPLKDPNQRFKQGALLTQDWAGGPLAAGAFLVADEIPAKARLNGTIHFLFACYGAGCPKFDTYTYGPDNKPVQVAGQDLVARLPQKMLLAGAQAVIGHIDRAWAYSFQNSVGTTMPQSFRDPLTRILQGRRVGDAIDIFDQRWTALGNDLSTAMLKRMAVPGAGLDALVENRWVARDDARNYIVLGDPAVRLRTNEAAPAAPVSGGQSFSISTAATEAPSAAAESFAPAVAHLEAKPNLNFRDFSAALEMKAGVSPDCSYQLVESVLATAGRGAKVDVYIYSISAPYMMDLLQSATARGAAIRVMYDPAQMANADAQKLTSMGLSVRVAPSHDPRRVFTVCHQKFVVVDRKTVLIESANWANTSIPFRKAGEERKIGNREWLVRIDDQAVASWYADLFQADWDIPALPGAFGIEVAAPPVPVPSFRAPRGVAPRDFGIMTFTGQQMVARPLTSPDNYFDEVLPLIRSAANRIWIQQQYILGAGGTTIPRLLEAVSRRGNDVDIRLIVSSKFAENWNATKDTLRDAGLIDKLRAINLDNFTHCHNKGVIVDDAVIISSTNWSENSVRRAREAGILIHSPSVAGFFTQVFADDWRTGWSVATADANAATFDLTAVAERDLEVDPADRV